MRRLVINLTLCLYAVAAHSQKALPDGHLQHLADDIIGYPDEEVNYEELYENLAQLLGSPYDLNRVSREELQQLHLLSDAQIRSFLEYRDEQGALIDIHELQIIPGFDAMVISRLLPFVEVIDPATRVNTKLLRRIISGGNGYLITRYERRISDPDDTLATSAYAGSPDKGYLRFRSVQSGDFSIGFTAEKDAGEKFLFQPRSDQWGFDFTSWHVQLRNKRRIRNLIVGDFQTQFAQGLVFGGGFGLGKGGESVSTARRSNVGFLPYTSVNESAYKRGIAITVDLSANISLSSFYSRTQRDATTSVVSGTPVVSSFQTNGYHRTKAEIARRKTVTEQNTGLILQVRKTNLHTGLLFNAVHFQYPVKRNPTLYNQFTFRGSVNPTAGVFLNYTIGNISFFSEAAQSLGAGRGIVAGILVTPYKNLDLAILYRDYQPDFHVLYANAFSESTLPQNERGIYWGWKYRWSRRINTTGYIDLFTFPWLGFRRYSPSQGYEWLIRVNYQPSKTVRLFVQVREESKERNVNTELPLYKTAAGIKRNFTFHSDYGIGEKIRLKTRIQYNSYHHSYNISDGLVLIQDLSCSAGPFRFSGRHSIFYTGSFDNRHYVYESDAWQSYSLPSYTGTGVRNYALIEIKVRKNVTLWFRYARTRLLKERDTGRTVQGFEVNTRNDVKFQARFSF